MKQTEEQFRLIHGAEETWSTSTAAGFRCLFRNGHRPAVAREMNLTPQAIYTFLGANRLKHLAQLAKLEEYNEYFNAGMDGKTSIPHTELTNLGDMSYSSTIEPYSES